MSTRGDRFRDFLRIVARGPTLSRPLDVTEAEEAFGLVLDGDVLPMQVGAFLLILRQRGETAAELAGMALAARSRCRIAELPPVDLDWPSYADAHRQLPYFLLAARLVAEAGVRVLMHGGDGDGGASTRHGLAALGMAVADTPSALPALLADVGFAYLPVETLCPPLAALLALKPVLGVRTAVNSVARELNPGTASAQLQGVFHPAYVELHVAVQAAIGPSRALTFKGGGGEGQRNPDKPCRAMALAGGVASELTWPRLTDEGWPWRGEPLDTGRLAALWRGDWSEPVPVAAVTGTAAMALWLAGKAADPADADRIAADLWRTRRRQLPPTA